MHIVTTIALISLSPLALSKSLWLNDTPQRPQPYAIKKGYGMPIHAGGNTWHTFPITGNSSGNAFSLMNTNGPGSGSLLPALFPHVHQKTYENFYSVKGRVQIWGQNLDSYLANTSEQTTRILGAGDFAGIPNNTVHTFNFLEPDTQLSYVYVPGGFEEVFFNTETNPMSGSGNETSEFTDWAHWDIYPQTDFQPRTDAAEGKAGPGNWYDGENKMPLDDNEPVWIAKNHGPKRMNSSAGYYQIISPLAQGPQTRGRFAQGHITMSLKPEAIEAPKITSPHATAFQVEEGQVAITADGYDTAYLIDGDVVFLPPKTTFTYWAEAEFTKFMYVSGGSHGLDAQLLQGAELWSLALYPRQG